MARQTQRRNSNYHKVFEAALRLTPDEQQRLREDLPRFSAVHLVPPAVSVTAKKKGEALADEVRADLAAQKRNESLDETMKQRTRTSMVILDTDVMLLAFAFHRDDRQKVNTAFLEKVLTSTPAITVYNLMEILGQLSFNLSPERLSAWQS